MKKIQSFAKKHWDEVIILYLTLILLLLVFFPFFLNNSLDKFDTPGLLSLSWFIREYAFPNFQGWNPYFFAGFPQGTLYPPLFHYLVAVLGKIFSLQVAYKLVVTTAAVFIPYTIYEFSLKIYKKKEWALLNTLFLLITLVFLPGYLGFNFDGLFDYGLGPSFVSIPLFFAYLTMLFTKKLSSQKIAAVFSILLLTHLLTAAVAGLITLGYLFHTKKEEKRSLVIFALIAFVLTAFWTIPFVIFRGFSASGLAMRISTIIPASILLLTLLSLGGLIFFKQFKKQGKQLSLLKTSFLIGLLGLIDSIINTSTTKFSIPLIHLFRVQIYGIVLTISCLPFLIQRLHPIFIKSASKLKLMRFLKRDFHVSFNLGFASLILFVLFLIRLNPTGVEEVEFIHTPDWEGRIMRSYKVTEVLDQSRSVIDNSVMDNPQDFAVDGLLKESSYLAPYYQSLAKSLNPDNYNWEELDEYYIENKQIPLKKVLYLMDLMWVKSLFTIDEHFPGCNVFQHLTSFTTNSKNEGLVERDMYICSYAASENSDLARILIKKPRVTNERWEDELDAWWLSDNDELFADKSLEIDLPEDIMNQVSASFSEDFQAITIKTDIQESLPVLVKVSYFPKWKAYDKDNNEIEIYRTSPNFMTIPVKEEVTLKYETTVLEWVTLSVSIISWLGLGIGGIAKKLQKNEI